MSTTTIVVCGVAYLVLAFLAMCIFAAGGRDPMEDARDQEANGDWPHVPVDVRRGGHA